MTGNQNVIALWLENRLSTDHTSKADLSRPHDVHPTSDTSSRVCCPALDFGGSAKRIWKRAERREIKTWAGRRNVEPQTPSNKSNPHPSQRRLPSPLYSTSVAGLDSGQLWPTPATTCLAHYLPGKTPPSSLYPTSWNHQTLPLSSGPHTAPPATAPRE
jgi:hypothetical protein